MKHSFLVFVLRNRLWKFVYIQLNLTPLEHPILACFIIIGQSKLDRSKSSYTATSFLGRQLFPGLKVLHYILRLFVLFLLNI